MTEVPSTQSRPVLGGVSGGLPLSEALVFRAARRAYELNYSGNIQYELYIRHVDEYDSAVRRGESPSMSHLEYDICVSECKYIFHAAGAGYPNLVQEEKEQELARKAEVSCRRGSGQSPSLTRFRNVLRPRR